ncbi:LysR family transcriptional regulator [Microtetraspora malaysiensis]|uniref:LysR family transcriptional regulator n=1 Tax=Microtetraspora malaysiensis TaxID=161358 RepID=A0ABW6SIY4_9ACTN
MELRHLRAFVAVARSGTVTAAANALGLAPASVSEQVRRLEGSLGVALFTRTSRGMRPTEAGARLLDRAQALLDHADEVRRAVTGARQRVRVGALEMLAATRLPSVVRRLAERRPDIDLEIASLPRNVLLAELATGGVDAGLLLDSGLRVGALGFPAPPDLEHLDVAEVALVMVAAPGHADRTLLVTSPECSARLAVERTVGREVPRRELPSVATVREWARQGLGMALLPDFVVEADLASGALVALDVAAPTLALRLVWTRGREEPLRDVLYALSA